MGFLAKLFTTLFDFGHEALEVFVGDLDYDVVLATIENSVGFFSYDEVCFCFFTEFWIHSLILLWGLGDVKGFLDMFSLLPKVRDYLI